MRNSTTCMSHRQRVNPQAELATQVATVVLQATGDLSTHKLTKSAIITQRIVKYLCFPEAKTYRLPTYATARSKHIKIAETGPYSNTTVFSCQNIGAIFARYGAAT